MPDEEYRAQISALASEWGGVAVDDQRPGWLRAVNDPTTGMLIGMRARLIAEIINRAIEAAK